MSQATEKAAAAVPVPIVKHIAPPFTGAGLGTIKSGPAHAGFWSAIRHDVSRGGLVVQLGGQPNQIPGTNFYDLAFAGFQYQFTVPDNPSYLYYVFGVRFNPGPVTVKNSGGNQVTPFCEAVLLDASYPIPERQKVVSNVPVEMAVGRFLEPRKTYRLQIKCGVEIFRFNSAEVPYGEVIIKDTDLQLTRYDYTNPHALKGTKAKAAAPVLEREAIIESVGSIEEAQAKGLVGMF